MSSQTKDLFTQIHQEHIRRLHMLRVTIDKIGLKMGDTYAMFFAEQQLMEKHAKYLLYGKNKSRVLEIGYGLGIFAGQISKLDISSYTAVEVHPDLVKKAEVWSKTLPHQISTRIINKPWQLCINELETYDVIMYDTWPPKGLENSDFKLFVENVCMKVLYEGGRFSFFNSGPQISPKRKRILESKFKSVIYYNYGLSVEPEYWTKSGLRFVIPIATFSRKNPSTAKITG